MPPVRTVLPCPVMRLARQVCLLDAELNTPWYFTWDTLFVLTVVPVVFSTYTPQPPSWLMVLPSTTAPLPSLTRTPSIQPVPSPAPITVKPFAAYFFCSASSVAYCGVLPHCEATLTSIRALPL